MIRVAFLKSRSSFRGGAEKYTQAMMQAFASKGCAVTLLTTGEPPKITGVEIVSLAPTSKWTLYHLVHFDALCKKWLSTNPHDIVFGMERTTNQTHYRAGNGVHAVYLQRRKAVDSWFKCLSFSLNPLHRTLLAMEKKAFEDPHLKVLFTNSFMVRDEILKTYGTAAKIEVVHNGVEWEAWGDAFEMSMRNRKAAPYNLLFIGNGYRRKGLQFLLQALEQFKKKDFQLQVIGKEKDPSFFMNMVKRGGLSDYVTFLGPQANILPYYQRADALVIPSIYDPFANVTVEALAMGLYVVTSPYNGAKEVLKEGAGTVIDDLNKDAVKAALEKAFDHPKTEASARNIRQSIKELDFSSQLDTIVHKTLQSI